MADYIIATDRKIIETYQTEADTQLGYPESLKSLRHVGPGIHAPKEIGRAIHYAAIDTDKTGTKFAIPAVDGKAVPKDATKEPLPADWKDIAVLEETQAIPTKRINN